MVIMIDGVIFQGGDTIELPAMLHNVPTAAVLTAAQQLKVSGRMISAVKFVRQCIGCDLKRAKDIVDNL